MLIKAVENNNYELIEFLIKNGIDVNFKNEDGKTALMILLEKNDLDENLIPYELFKPSFNETYRNRTILEMICDRPQGKRGIIKNLIKFGCNVNKKIIINFLNNCMDTPECLELAELLLSVSEPEYRDLCSIQIIKILCGRDCYYLVKNIFEKSYSDININILNEKKQNFLMIFIKNVVLGCYYYTKDILTKNTQTIEIINMFIQKK